VFTKKLRKVSFIIKKDLLNIQHATKLMHLLNHICCGALLVCLRKGSDLSLTVNYLVHWTSAFLQSVHSDACGPRCGHVSWRAKEWSKCPAKQFRPVQNVPVVQWLCALFQVIKNG